MLSVIEWRFSDEELAVRYPEENFSTSSVIFVQPGQEAILVKEGQICDILKEGRRQLTTENIPIFRRLFSFAFGKKEQFQCYVYFINKEKELTVRWGTADPRNVVDSRTGLLIRRGARGSFSVKVDNSGVFLAKCVGQVDSFLVNDLSGFLFSKTIETITTKIAESLQYKGISFTQIASHYSELSDDIYERLRTTYLFENYGLALRTFSIKAINRSDEDFAKIQETENQFVNTRRQAAAEADARRRKGFAEGDVRRNQGIYFDKKRSYDVLEAAAKNESGGNRMNRGRGLGRGVGLGTGFGNQRNQRTTNLQATNQQPRVNCPKCGTRNPSNAKFCSGCGAPLNQPRIRCLNCHGTNPSGAKFCSHCGANLAPSKSSICPDCGRENAPGAKFCSGCGKKLGD